MPLPVLSGSLISRSARAGTLFATWYDGREIRQLHIWQPGRSVLPDVGAQVHRQRRDLARRHAFIDVISPLPAQPDATVQADYAGDYDYGSAIASKHVTSWDDGRVTVSGQSQQDAFFDKEPAGRWHHRRPIDAPRRVCRPRETAHQVATADGASADGGYQSKSYRRRWSVVTISGNSQTYGQATEQPRNHTGTFTYQVCETDSGDCSE